MHIARSQEQLNPRGCHFFWFFPPPVSMQGQSWLIEMSALIVKFRKRWSLKVVKWHRYPCTLRDASVSIWVTPRPAWGQNWPQVQRNRKNSAAFSLAAVLPEWSLCRCSEGERFTRKSWIKPSYSLFTTTKPWSKRHMNIFLSVEKKRIHISLYSIYLYLTQRSIYYKNSEYGFSFLFPVFFFLLSEGKACVRFDKVAMETSAKKWNEPAVVKRLEKSHRFNVKNNSGKISRYIRWITRSQHLMLRCFWTRQLTFSCSFANSKTLQLPDRV